MSPKKAIRVRSQECPIKKLNISKSEFYCMRIVMKESGGSDCPWFYRYQIIKGL